MAWRNLALGAFVTALAVGYLVATAQIHTFGGTESDEGFRTFPYIVGAVLLAVSAPYTVVQALRLFEIAKKGADSDEEEAPTTEEERPSHAEPSPARGAHTPTPADTRAPTQTQETPDIRASEGWRRFPHVLMLACAVAYVILLTVLGFLPATALFVAVGVFLTSDAGTYRGARLIVPVLFGAVLSVLLYAFFEDALNVALPPGVLGIGGW